MPVVTIFGDGNVKPDEDIYHDAELTGKLLAENNWNIATGSYYGIMEAVLKRTGNQKIKRFGVSLDFYNIKVNEYVDTVIATNDYLERLSTLIKLGDSFIAFPGGTGTMLEISAVLALKQRNLIDSETPFFCVGNKWEILKSLFDPSIIKFIEFSDTGIKAAETILNYKK